MVQGQPGQTTFRLDNQYEFNISLDRLWLVARAPQPSLAAFAEQFEHFASVCKHHLRIGEFSRVGLRHILTRKYESKELASAAFLGFGLIRAPQPCFGVTNRPIFPAYSLRWEDEGKGCLVNCRVEERKFQLEVPFGWESEAPTDKIEPMITLDIDYYSMGRIGVDQMRFTDWIKQAVHIVRRDSSTFLERK